MDPRRRLPEALAVKASHFAAGRAVPAPVKHASTVVLMRGGNGSPGSVEVYLLRRAVSMKFAGGFSVFPGGGVDPRDSDADVRWVGPTPQDWAGLFGGRSADQPANEQSRDLARALVCAAVRETFEEAGVLLAGPSAETIVADTTSAGWEADRASLEARRLSLTDLLARRDLLLRTDLLAYWGTWITPDFEPRRYDTRFFVAELPAGQTTRDVSTESDRVMWLTVGEILREVSRGKITMLPPTYATCLELFEAGSAAQVRSLAQTKDRSPILPQMQVGDDGAYLALPDRLVELGREVEALLETDQT